EAHMAYGFVFTHGTAPVKRVGHPDGAVLLPISGSLPAVAPDGVPAIGEPEFGAAITVIGDEVEILADADRPVRNPCVLEEDAMFGTFIVEGKTRTGMTNGMKAFRN